MLVLSRRLSNRRLSKKLRKRLGVSSFAKQDRPVQTEARRMLSSGVYNRPVQKLRFCTGRLYKRLYKSVAFVNAGARPKGEAVQKRSFCKRRRSCSTGLYKSVAFVNGAASVEQEAPKALAVGEVCKPSAEQEAEHLRTTKAGFYRPGPAYKRETLRSKAMRQRPSGEYLGCRWQPKRMHNCRLCMRLDKILINKIWYQKR